MAITKERLHQLVDELADQELPAAERYLERLKAANAAPVLRALLSAAPDDEPETEDERAAVAEGVAALERGEVSTSPVQRAVGA